MSNNDQQDWDKGLVSDRTDSNLETCFCIGPQVVGGRLEPRCPCGMRDLYKAIIRDAKELHKGAASFIELNHLDEEEYVPITLHPIGNAERFPFVDKLVGEWIEVGSRCLWDDIPAADRNKPMLLSCPCPKCTLWC